MKPRNALIVLAVGLLVLIGGWFLGPARLPGTSRHFSAGKLMFPDLAPRLQQAARVEVVHQGKLLVIEKRSVNGAVRWGLADRGGYPVQETKLRGMLTALTELRLVDPRTANPQQFATLGVEDHGRPTSNSDLLRVLNAAGNPIVALIVGHRRVRTGANVPAERYVRLPNDNQSWLAEGNLEVDADPLLWLDRVIMNIDHSRIATVAVTRDNATLEFSQADAKLRLTAPANHPKLDDYKLEDVARALELLTFDDVHPDAAAPGTPIGTAVFSTGDGLTVTATVYPTPPDASAKPAADRDVLARFSAAGTGKAKPEADRLQGRLAGWTYELGAWKQKSLVPSLDDLQAPPPAPAQPAAAGARP